MGGLGSGTWQRRRVREYLNDHISIDVRYLKRKGWLDEEYHTNMSWSYDGVVTDRVFVFTEPGAVKFRFAVQNTSGTFSDKTVSVPLVGTGCNYGGQRHWFTCPSCEGRVALIYKVGQTLKCRKCCNLPYESQSENEIVRMQRRKYVKFRELKVKYGMEFPFNSKPKGMHQEKYQCIRGAALDLWLECDLALDEMLDELNRQYEEYVSS